MSKVVFFGLDGATFTLFDDLVERGVMPHLGRFLTGGTRATLASIVPPLTPPAWTTLVTGRTPGHHGIFNFLQYESDHTRYVRLVNSRQIHCETIWSMVNRYGRRAGCMNFVVHNPAPKMDGYAIPGWISWRWMKRQSHPADIIERLASEVPGFDVKELAMDFDQEEKAIAGTFTEEYEPWIDLHIRRERQWFNLLKHQMANDPCDLTAIVFDGVDKLQHLCWRFLDPALEPEKPTEEYLRVRERCLEYYRQLDGFLEETVQMAGPDAQVFIASDHGFAGTHEVLHINTWLEQQGFLTWAADAPVQSEDSQQLGTAGQYHLRSIDFARTRAYAMSASNNGIQIPVAGQRGPEGIAPGDYEAVRRELIDALLTRCVDPNTGERLITQVWTREEISPGPRMHAGPDLVVALRDHGNFSVMRCESVLKKRPAVLGCHHPQGLFAAAGPCIRKGAQIGPLRLVDMAPTFLYAMGLPVPEDLEGRVVTEAFAPDYVAANEVAYGPPTVPPAHLESAPVAVAAASAGATEGYDPEGQAQVMARLKALGYVE
jgi:predicted AlkP superfamily phosphohydrolase/phosphomutase